MVSRKKLPCNALFVKSSDSGISGNERPCIECKRRGLTETCVDGDRKIPKYLYDMSDKPPNIGIYYGRAHLNAPANSTDSWKLSSNSVNQLGATFEEQVDPSLEFSTEQGPNDFVDPAIVHIESPILLLSRETAKNHCQEGMNPKVQFLRTDMSSFPVLPVGCHGAHGIENVLGGKIIGFTISSGWSSTFLPCGMSEEP